METAVTHDGASRSWRSEPVNGFGRLHLAATRLLELSRTTTFGNVVIVLFFVSQALDGAFTYVGIRMFGPSIEGNPLLAWLMGMVGAAPALAGAKLLAAGFGMILHLAAVHRAVAVLTAIYVSAALLPWMVVFALVGKIH